MHSIVIDHYKPRKIILFHVASCQKGPKRTLTKGPGTLLCICLFNLDSSSKSIVSISMEAQPHNIKPSKIIIKILIYHYRPLNTCHPVKIPVVPNSQSLLTCLLLRMPRSMNHSKDAVHPLISCTTLTCAQLGHRQLRKRFKEQLFMVQPQDATRRPKGIERMRTQRAEYCSKEERLLKEKETLRHGTFTRD